MANTKISLLTALTGVNVAPATDLIPIVDTSATETKQITVAQLLIGMGVTGTNTGDETTATIKTKLGITTLSGSNTGDQDLSSYLTSATAASTYEPLKGANDNFVTDAQLVVIANTSGTNTGDNAVNSLYSGLVSNATHTGDVTGATALTIASAAITGKTLVTGVGSDYVLISDTSDSGNLKKCLISDFASAGGDMAAATYDPANIAQQVVGLTATQTLTNKTLTSPIMTTPTLGVATATSINKVAITAPATSATLTIADGATLTASATASVSGTNTGDQTITLQGDVTGTGTGTFTTTIATGAVDIAMLSATGTPSATTFLRGDNTWATPSGGGGGTTFDDSTFNVYDNADNTKILAFQVSGVTTATTRTLTIPDASGTITLNDSTATLTNKTLTAPKFASNGFIADANGNELLEFESVAIAVNHLKIVNDITNGDPYIEVVGDDANVGMFIVAKGNGFFALDSTTQTTGSTRGQYAVDLQIFRSSASNVSSGNYSFSANYQNTASGSSSVALGNSTQATAQTTFAIGQNTISSGQESFAGGFRSRAALRGAFSWSGGMHSTGGNTGDNQYTLLCARRYITGVTSGQTGITLYIGDGTSTEIIPDVTSLTYRTWTVRVQWNVVISAISGTADGLAASDTVGAMDTIVLKKTGSTVTVLESSLGTVVGSTNMKTGIAMGYTASGTNFRINLVAPTYTNTGTLTLKAHATLQISENGY